MPATASAFSQGFAMSLALIVAIGAQNAFVLRQGLRREHVGPVVLWCALCDAALIAAGAMGLARMLHDRPALATALSALGAVFLLVYGVAALRRTRGTAALQAHATGRGAPLGTVLAQAAGFTLLNPHVYLDTVLLIGGAAAQQPDALVGWFTAGAALASAVWFTALGHGAQRMAPLLARPQAWRWIDALVGGTMLAFAALLAHRAGQGVLAAG